MKTDVAIIGAGPYGLSLAAQLRGHSVDTRIFGTPMQTWRDHMPAGMHLKSEGFASTLFDGENDFTLERYCEENRFAYRHSGLPVPLDQFCDYGESFQARKIPTLEKQDVVALEPAEGGFSLTLADGRVCHALRVVIATGIAHYETVPDWLAGLPASLAGHSSRYPRPRNFSGRRVAVIGAGASAIDMAALLGEAGAQTDLIVRSGRLAFLGPPAGRARTMWESLRAPQSGLGPGWKSRFCTDAPLLFRAFPESFRHTVVRRHLGPSAGWWTRAPVERLVTVRLNTQAEKARPTQRGAELTLRTDAGAFQTETYDQVIAATGYRPDLRRLPYLAPGLREKIAATTHIPRLSANFETSVPGLYITGLAAAYTFGPMLRFAYGAGFTAQRLSRHLAKRRAAIVVGAALPAAAHAPAREAAEAA